MSESDLRGQVFEILHRVAPEADLGRIGENENLRETLDIDSFDFLQVIVALNQKFGVTIPESDYRRVNTLKGMMDYLRAR